MKNHIVKLGMSRKSLIAYLKEDMDLSSRGAKALLGRGIQINGKKAYGDSRLKDGDLLLIEEDLKKDNIAPQKMEIDILYEDDDIVAVDKPPYMVVHPTKNHKKGTLANGLRYYFDEKDINEPVRFFNRIDMNTSGIVIIPKSSRIHSLMDRYSAGSLEKKYMAVVSGIPKNKKGRIESLISDHPDEAGKRYLSDEGKFAVTEYEVLEEYASASLLALSIKTGRTHQIRVHLSGLGHPILGDTLYGGDDARIKRQALHASELSFTHPVRDERIAIKSQLPSDILMLLKGLKEDLLN
ncbi:RluA family pseudouridine synthase [Lutispora saccharofermentans]|uniref:Pseudouridine synthase n=1 Tax=Lutispora saccharofermentans TaxID=3024236 RepID=A0ABT1NA81_9FIRM|nr:RluA family pseudouridine synthase [Lutispora saccharofermentans]MCQ1528165.1 RluA family pseudouridine synthase [Lutispora saccharofermentans]